MLWHLHVPIPREQLLQFFRLPDLEASAWSLTQLRNKNGSGMPDFITTARVFLIPKPFPCFKTPNRLLD